MDTRTLMQLTVLALYIAVAVLICFASADGPTTASPVGGHNGTTQSKIHNASMPASGNAKRNNDRTANVTQPAAGQHQQSPKPKAIQKQQGTPTRTPAMPTPASITRTRSPTVPTPATINRTRSPTMPTPATISPEKEKQNRQKQGLTTRKSTAVSRRSATEASKPQSSLPTSASTRKNVISHTKPSTTTTTKTTRRPSPVTTAAPRRACAPPQRIGRFRACDEPCVCACEKAACKRRICSSIEKGGQDNCSVRCWNVCFNECAKTGLRP